MGPFPRAWQRSAKPVAEPNPPRRPLLPLLRSGPVSEVLPYFENLGFACPVRKDPGSFLQASAGRCPHRLFAGHWPFQLALLRRRQQRLGQQGARDGSGRFCGTAAAVHQAAQAFPELAASTPALAAPLTPALKQEVTTPLGQMLYATPILLEAHGLSAADQDPVRLLEAPPKDLLVEVQELSGGC